MQKKNPPTTPRASANGRNLSSPQDKLCSARAKDAKETIKRRPITGPQYFHTLLEFTKNCRTDKRITPHTQLIYRVLADLANRAYWAFPFEVTDEELKAITHITSSATLNSCKRTLKNLGYIDFYGRPNKITLYTPVEREVERKLERSGPPGPPGLKTGRQEDEIGGKKETSKKERRREDGSDRRSDQGATEGQRERLRELLKRRRERGE